MKPVNIVLILLIMLAVMLSGCTSGQDITPVVRAIPDVQEFLKEHPNAKITITYWSKEDSGNLVDEISRQCDKTITPSAMYKAVFSEGDIRSISWIDAQTRTVICSTVEGAGGTPSPNSTTVIAPVETPASTSTQVVTPAPIITSTSTVSPTPAQDSLELKNGYKLKLARIEGMNEVRSPDGTLTTSKGANVRIIVQLIHDGNTVNEQTVPEGTAFSLTDEEKIIVKANFKTIFIGTVTYMIKLENVVQYDTSGGVIFTRDVATLILPYP